MRRHRAGLTTLRDPEVWAQVWRFHGRIRIHGYNAYATPNEIFTAPLDQASRLNPLPKNDLEDLNRSC